MKLVKLTKFAEIYGSGSVLNWKYDTNSDTGYAEFISKKVKALVKKQNFNFTKVLVSERLRDVNKEETHAVRYIQAERHYTTIKIRNVIDDVVIFNNFSVNSRTRPTVYILANDKIYVEHTSPVELLKYFKM